jgi:L,D-transpeptidase YcbB
MHTNDSIAGIPAQPPTNKLKFVLVRIGHLLLLSILMVLLASHVNTNPKSGNNNIEFYKSECENLLEIQVNNLLPANESNANISLDFELNKLVARFYSIRNYQAVWTINYKTTDNYTTLKSLLDSANYFGFPGDYFHTKALNTLNAKFTSSSKTNSLNCRVELEIMASREMFRLILCLNKGIIQTDTSRAFKNFTEHLPLMLNNALNNGKLNEVISNLQPNLRAYKSLLSELPEFLNTLSLLINANDSLLQEKLIRTSMLYLGMQTPSNPESVDNSELLISLYQQANKLPADGKFTSETKKMLCKNLQDKYLNICLNLDRFRKISSVEDDYLFINIPEYKLYVVEDNKIKVEHNVIVGNKTTPTPVICSKIERIIANPNWTVPRSIATNEMLLKIKKDSTYLKRNGYIIVTGKEKPVDIASIDWSGRNPLGNDLWIRQVNSKDNALGQVKFVFPNEHQVYLHDTPGKQLFKKQKRAFSHGCIRVENPLELAQLILDDFNKQTGKSYDIKSLVDKKQSSVIELSTSIGIYIQYITCSVNSEGNIVFLDDIYNLDEASIISLFKNDTAI